MKRCSRVLPILALALSIVLMLTGCNEAVKLKTFETEKRKTETIETVNNKKVKKLPVQLGVDEDTSEKFLINYTEIARNKDTIMYADKEKGFFALQDIETEKIWYSTPNNSELDEFTSGTERMEMRSQLLCYFILREEEGTVSSYKIENSQSSCVGSEDGIEVELIENGLKVVYNFKKSRISVPVTYTLTENGFRAEILANEIDEGSNAFLIGLNLLPMFGAGDWDDKGELFVPDGCGALIEFNDHRIMDVAYNREVYGSEKTLKSEAEKLQSQQLRMPVFGIITDNNTLMGIITDGDASSSIAAIYGNESCGYNSVSGVFNYRSVDCKEMYSKQGGINSTLYRVSKQHAESDIFAVNYYLLNNSDSGYIGMAKKYRNYLLENGMPVKNEIKPLLNLEVYGAAELSTSFLGVDYRKTQVLTTFDQAQQIIDKFKEKGIADLGVRYVGFTGNGILNRKMTTSASPIGKLGNKKSFIKLGNSVKLYPDFDVMQIKEGNSMVSLSSGITRTVFDYKSEQLAFSHSVYSKLLGSEKSYFLNAPTVHKVTRKIISNSEKAGYNNISYSNLGNTIYSDFNPKLALYRDGMLAYVNDLFKTSNEKFDSVAAEDANAYAFENVDRIWNAPIYSSGYDIFKTDIPFYQLVIHGSIAHTTPCVIQSQDPATTVLKAVETGSELLFACTYEDSSVLIGSEFEDSYSTCYKNWIDYAVDIYEDYQPILEKIYSSAIVSHQEVTDGVFITGYENGYKVAVNYGDEDITLKSGETVKGKGYILLSGGGIDE